MPKRPEFRVFWNGKRGWYSIPYTGVQGCGKLRTKGVIPLSLKEYDELKRRIEGEAKGGTRTDLGYAITEVEGWSLQKTADDLGISKPAVVKAIKIATAIEEHPELVGLRRGQAILW